MTLRRDVAAGKRGAAERPGGTGRKSPQAFVATLGALVVVVIGLALLAILVVGIADGVASTGVLLLGALCLGVFALAARLGYVALQLRREAAAPPARPAAPRRPAPAQPPRPAGRTRPQPRPRA
ncbi:hypothetical protein Cs7R123_19710 [Catellatospora sp. TT07R-123]|uniref:hypothetical protein n=1 Tax=Catellatospora sp. TT07R-123 TaxID=2733863 RepID=UPI001B2E7D48|nr:hypothetical protein [Catellatospora sp. TT07R-123]GHJ44629.1 hypothetical protein Cs7R123_19710 [Catellatospora sp. TT07R-123]